VLKLIATGKTNRDIGAVLGITEHTIILGLADAVATFAASSAAPSQAQNRISQVGTPPSRIMSSALFMA
jgi:transketolase C-terminal domain/subunit